MPSANGRPRSTVDELARRLRPGMTALNPRFSWHALFPVPEEDLHQYLNDPVAALPPAVCDLLPKIGIVLAPYLERPVAKGPVSVVGEKPAEPKLVLSTSVASDDQAMLFFTVKDEQVADYHYFLFDEIAAIVSRRWPAAVQEVWYALLREEIAAEVHGEVDERSWHLKQTLLRRPLTARQDGKPFRDYARESFRDTLTLLLHGICCDIDVETGPRQIPSRFLRKRLEHLKTLFPPPEGHAVFPEDLPQSRSLV
ncbi:MAG: hypothetical protein ABUS49_11785 [Acidobacteriota bacterium]